MKLEETKISQIIIDNYHKRLKKALHLDVAIAGAGPAGMVAGTLLAKKGLKVAIFEKKLAPGGGVWGGGMMYNEIVVQKPAVHILKSFKINHQHMGGGYYAANAVETASGLCYRFLQAGGMMFNCISVADTMLRNNRLTGLVLNWTPVELVKLHVDPLVIGSKYVIDGTGHDADVTSVLVRKSGLKLHTPSGGIEGEKPMWADDGERTTVANTKEIFPGLYVVGMAANAVFGGHRMGPVFGGMLLSGEKVAKELIGKLKG